MTVRFLAPLLLLAGLAASPAQALESNVVASPRAQVSLVSESDAFQPGQALRIGLRLRMAPGWYTYWRNPGDAGAPAELDFQLPEGATAGPIAWPTPARHATGPVMSYGYEGEILLPVTISLGGTLTLPATLPAEPLTLQLHATWLVCERICVPEEADFTLTLPPGTPSPSAEAPLFAAADANTPHTATTNTPWQAEISPDGILSLRLPGLDATQVREAWFAPYAWGQIEHSAAQTLSTAEGGFTLALRPGGEFRHQAGLQGIVVVTDHTGRTTAMELAATPGATAIPAATLPLWQLVAFALAAGMILNLMPCVFPVLAMKAIGLATIAGKSRGAALAQAGAYAAGVLFTFLALAGTLVAMRAAGSVVGWGFQFQSPVFVAATAWLLLAIGLNMSGLYAIGGGSVANLGASTTQKGGLLGSFLTGLLAVLVATPCTAPFMGAAIAGALAAPLGVTVLGFVAMGAGFALPYVLFAAIPGFARMLPRPGAWMDILRQALAFPMYAAAVWLLWVVSLQAGPTGVLTTASGMLLVAFALWALGLAQSRAGTGTSALGRRLATASAVLAGLGAVAVLTTLATTPAATASPSDRPQPDASEPFTPRRLAELRAAGTPVFVNMTAAWCVTCIVNEQVALAQPAIREAFAAGGVTYLKGDWTRRDPAITDYLRAMGRDGVPLYVLYPGKAAAPVILPQILTEARLLQELARTQKGDQP